MPEAGRLTLDHLALLGNETTAVKSRRRAGREHATAARCVAELQLRTEGVRVVYVRVCSFVCCCVLARFVRLRWLRAYILVPLRFSVYMVMRL